MIAFLNALFPYWRLALRYGVVFALTGVLLTAVKYLVNELTNAEANEGLVAILAGAITAIGQTLIQAGKDLFSTNDQDDSNGVTEPSKP